MPVTTPNAKLRAKMPVQKRARDLVKIIAFAQEVPDAKVQQEQREPHGELGKEIMKCRGDSELKAVVLESDVHK